MHCANQIRLPVEVVKCVVRPREEKTMQEGRERKRKVGE